MEKLKKLMGMCKASVSLEINQHIYVISDKPHKVQWDEGWYIDKDGDKGLYYVKSDNYSDKQLYRILYSNNIQLNKGVIFLSSEFFDAYSKNPFERVIVDMQVYEQSMYMNETEASSLKCTSCGYEYKGSKDDIHLFKMNYCPNCGTKVK